MEYDGILWLQPQALPPGEAFDHKDFNPDKELHGTPPPPPPLHTHIVQLLACELSCRETQQPLAGNLCFFCKGVSNQDHRMLSTTRCLVCYHWYAYVHNNMREVSSSCIMQGGCLKKFHSHVGLHLLGGSIALEGNAGSRNRLRHTLVYGVVHSASCAGVMATEERHGLTWDRQITIDLPRIDFSLLLENICDPDHGVFAHQVVPLRPLPLPLPHVCPCRLPTSACNRLQQTTLPDRSVFVRHQIALDL